jgi:hypothetical protein
VCCGNSEPSDDKNVPDYRTGDDGNDECGHGQSSGLAQDPLNCCDGDGICCSKCVPRDQDVVCPIDKHITCYDYGNGGVDGERELLGRILKL